MSEELFDIDSVVRRSIERARLGGAAWVGEGGQLTEIEGHGTGAVGGKIDVTSVHITRGKILGHRQKQMGIDMWYIGSVRK